MEQFCWRHRKVFVYESKIFVPYIIYMIPYTYRYIRWLWKYKHYEPTIFYRSWLEIPLFNQLFGYQFRDARFLEMMIRYITALMSLGFQCNIESFQGGIDGQFIKNQNSERAFLSSKMIQTAVGWTWSNSQNYRALGHFRSSIYLGW